MKITVEIRDVYGKPTVYPVCQMAKLFADVAGTKTLTDHTLSILKRMGYTIELKPQTFKI